MNKTNNIRESVNLIGKDDFKTFLEIQAAYGYAQRGGAKIPFHSEHHLRRIATNVNFLDKTELKKIIFSETICCN